MKQTNRKRRTLGDPVNRRQRGFVNSRQALVLLALLFLMPVFVAWFMHLSAEHGWRPGGTTNKGTLVQPLQAAAYSGSNDRALSKNARALKLSSFVKRSKKSIPLTKFSQASKLFVASFIQAN